MAVGLAAVGCVPPYRPPSASEPHAVMKVRRTYDAFAGTSLREVVDINEHRAYADGTPAAASKSPRIDAILVHPVPASVEVKSEFFHTEQRTVQERYTEQVPESYSESYDCSTGYGTSRSHRTCTRMATRYRTEHKTRWVTKTVEVTDGACGRSFRFGPAVGRVYLVQYSYQDHGVCTLSCYEQVPGANGEFSNAPCPPAPPAAD